MSPTVRSTLEALLVAGALIGGAAVGCNSPDDECSKGYRPSDCIVDEPSTGILRVKVTISGMNPSVPITVYYGSVDGNQIAFVDTLVGPAHDYRVANSTYAVKAKYKAYIDNVLATVYSIEGGSLSTERKDYCDGSCYSEGTLELDASYP